MQLITALVLTLCIAVVLPVYAWFTEQRKAAEMYKIQYPNSLFINAAHREDRMYFDLDELNVDDYFKAADGTPTTYQGKTEKDHRLYAFSVSGEGTTRFILQLSHTNNNELNYKIYEADQLNSAPLNGVENYTYVHYERHIGSNSENTLSFSDDLPNNQRDAYYQKKTDGNSLEVEVSGTVKNPHATNSKLADNTTSNRYYDKTYRTNSSEVNSKVEAHAVPTYWQATVTVYRSEIDVNTKQFHKYYILEVSWDPDTQENTKETDLVYLAVKQIG